MARARAIRSLLFVILSLLLCSLLPTRAGGGGGGGPCPRVPSMTAARACRAVCGTRHMRALCRHTLPPPPAVRGAGAAVPVTGLAAAAVRGALDAYAATTAAAESLVDGGAVKDDGEKAAYGNCMVGYGRARIAMARVADDLAGGGCDRTGELEADYTEGLRGMDMCNRGMLNYPASPLYAMNLADRNKTLLAALLCSLVAPPSTGQRLVFG
ncbi:hypothetical protein EJB05_09854, partial [Eragrostis curvula]